MLYFRQNNATVRHLMTKSSSNGHRPSHRMPQNSLFYERVVPILLIGMAVVTVALILLAAGVLLGFISF
jgi:hypothetical protein